MPGEVEKTMVSTRTPVRLQGVIRGDKYEATCMIEATKVTATGLPDRFTNYMIRNRTVSKDLPEGEIFALETNKGDRSHIRREGDYWVAI